MFRGVLCIYYEDDIFTKFTMEHPEIVVRMPIVTIIPPNLVYYIGSLLPITEEYIETLLKYLEKDKDTLFFEILQKKEEEIKLILCRKKLGETEKALYETRSFLGGPVIIKKGVRYYPVVVESYKHGKRLEELTKKYFGSQDVNVLFKILDDSVEILFTTVDDIISTLSEKEKECLLSAYELGYFEWPRIHDATEISKHLNISRTTFHEHMRKAEKKIVRYIYKSLRKV